MEIMYVLLLFFIFLWKWKTRKDNKKNQVKRGSGAEILETEERG
jgi:uncharacterized membrane protein